MVYLQKSPKNSYSWRDTRFEASGFWGGSLNFQTKPYFLRHLGMGQYLLIPFLGEWTSIYQLFWCSPGVQGFDPSPFWDPAESTLCSQHHCPSSNGPLLAVPESQPTFTKAWMPVDLCFAKGSPKPSLSATKKIWTDFGSHHFPSIFPIILPLW